MLNKDNLKVGFSYLSLHPQLWWSVLEGDMATIDQNCFALIIRKEKKLSTLMLFFFKYFGTGQNLKNTVTMKHFL